MFQRIGEEEGDPAPRGRRRLQHRTPRHFVRWKRDGLLAPLPARGRGEDPAARADRSRRHLSRAAFALLSPIAYNTKLVGAPGRAQELRSTCSMPGWQGRIVKARPGLQRRDPHRDLSARARARLVLIPKKLAPTDRSRMLQSASEPPKWLARGERAVQADGAERRPAAAEGSRARRSRPSTRREGTPADHRSERVSSSSAPHPNAARLFQSFLFSVEAQQVAGRRLRLYARSTRRRGRSPDVRPLSRHQS